MHRVIVKTNELLRGQFGRFVLAGVISATAEILVLVILVEVAELSYLVGNVFAFILANVINYSLSRYWVFERSGRRKRIELPIFTFFLAFGLIISQTALWTLVTYVVVDYRIAKVVSIGLIVIWNFLTRRHFVFNSGRKLTASSVLSSKN